MGFIGSGYESYWPMFGNRYSVLGKPEPWPVPSLASGAGSRDLSPPTEPAKSRRCPNAPKAP
jgi:hypothetical protein